MHAMRQGGEDEERTAADDQGGGAGKWCPSCGTGWVDQLDECPDCDTPLEPLPSAAPPGPATPEDAHLEYELDDWDGASRVMLEQLLVAGNVPHAWQGGRLVVPERTEDLVDAYVEQVEVATGPRLDPDAEQVAFDLEGWSDDLVDELTRVLDAEELPWELVAGDGDAHELVVLAADADRVEELVDGLEHPHALPLDDDGTGDDGDDEDERGEEIDPDKVLGGLFVACDRLAKDARDHQGVLGAADASRTLLAARAPYGFDRTTWTGLRERAEALLELLEGDDPASDEVVEEAAADLRTALRPLV